MAKQDRQSRAKPTPADDAPDLSSWTTAEVLVRGRRFAVCTKPGMPEHRAPDPAAALLAANLEVARADVVLNLNCGAGLVGTVAATLAAAGRVIMADANLVAVEAATRTARANGATNAAAILSMGTSRLAPLLSVDVAVARVPKGRLSTLQLIWDAFRALRPEGRLYLAGANDEGIQSALARARELFGHLTVLDYARGARVGLAVKEAASGEIPKAFADPLLDHATFHAYAVAVRGRSYQVRSRPGVFSWDELDPATRLLAETMEITSGDRVLDLGCGTGILGVVAADLARPGPVVLVDADADAVDSAEQTVAANGATNCEVLPSDSTSAVADRRFDVVVTNPPFHVARGTEHDVARQFFRDAAAVLAERGRFYVVANRFLAYEADLRQTFPVVETIHADNRYKVLQARPLDTQATLALESRLPGARMEDAEEEPVGYPVRKRRRRRVPIVDSHCHVSPVWYEPVEVLLFQMERNGVDHAVLIQMQGQANNDYQFECVRQHPGRFANVVIVDTNRPDAPQALERLASRGASGVRLTATTRSPGSDPLAIWRAAARLGLSISCGGSASGFASDEFARLIQEVPSVPIVVEHLGSVNHPVADLSEEEARQRVFGLARFPNVYLKIHGLGEFAPRALPVTEPFPFKMPIPSLLELAFEAFGPARMMWGSDYPPVSGREGYHNALRLTVEQLANRSPADRDQIFGGTALKVFPVR